MLMLTGLHSVTEQWFCYDGGGGTLFYYFIVSNTLVSSSDILPPFTSSITALLITSETSILLPAVPISPCSEGGSTSYWSTTTNFNFTIPLYPTEVSVTGY